MKTTIAITAAILLTGCATKEYGRIHTPSTYGMDCQRIEAEIKETHAFLDEVDRKSQFNVRSVSSFMLDFGLGNMMDKQDALDSAEARLAVLEDARREQGC